MSPYVLPNGTKLGSLYVQPDWSIVRRLLSHEQATRKGKCQDDQYIYNTFPCRTEGYKNRTLNPNFRAKYPSLIASQSARCNYLSPMNTMLSFSITSTAVLLAQ